MGPKKNRKRPKKAADAGKSKSEPTSSSPLPTISTTPNSCVPHLPPEIMMSILSRLPVRSLVRFKGVCEQWKSLITSQEFIKIHYNRFSESPKTCSANSHLLDCSKLGLIPHKKKADLDKPVDFILEICRGLICMSRPLASDRIILWNPATRLWKVVPHLAPRHRGNIEGTAVGFGCNEEGDDYKVVRIHRRTGKKMKVNVEVYSSKSDDWTTVNAGMCFRPMSVPQEVVVSGNPHWLVRTKEKELSLLRFDSTKMLFEPIRIPSQRGRGTLTFVDLCGQLGVLQCAKRSDDYLDKINVLAYANGEWIHQWSIDCAGGLRGVEGCEAYSWRKGVIVYRCMLTTSLSEYDVKERYVRGFGTERGETGILRLNPFEESLAHVRGMAAMDWATPVAEGEDKLKKCISEGFFTWVMPHQAGNVQVYYPLAS